MFLDISMNILKHTAPNDTSISTNNTRKVGIHKKTYFGSRTTYIVQNLAKISKKNMVKNPKVMLYFHMKSYIYPKILLDC